MAKANKNEKKKSSDIKKKETERKVKRYEEKPEKIEKAKESDVPVHEDDKLANTLSKLEIGDLIPPELYEVVAEILIFVDSMDKIKNKLKG